MKTIALALALSLTSEGCAYFKSSTAGDLKQCGIDAFDNTKKAASDILLSGNPDYKTQLENLGVSVGWSALSCVLHVVISDFQGKAGAGPTNLVADRYSAAAARGRVFLAAHGE